MPPLLPVANENESQEQALALLLLRGVSNVMLLIAISIGMVLAMPYIPRKGVCYMNDTVSLAYGPIRNAYTLVHLAFMFLGALSRSLEVRCLSVAL